ncbi:BgtA-21130 [Blumeria graminis f. sp. tritici]|uniref:BgtA-21130 n=1 Tax=Blumeria graminis f. sp. tritici TaxID=62690 RepID=A0A9X9QEQ0_BLUGR|nr:BgtA-21130 [Blumeria graminis f. sp. tritici]
MNQDPNKADSVVSTPAPKKRSLFSKQALAKVSVSKDPVDFFSRAKSVYPQLLEEEEKKRQLKLEQVERKRLSGSAELREATPPEKKKRVDACENNNEVPTGETSCVVNKRHNIDSDGTNGQVREKSFGDVTYPKERECIILDDKDERVEKSSVVSKAQMSKKNAITSPILADNQTGLVSRQQSPKFENQNDISDEEFSEFIQQARDREKHKAFLRLNKTKQQSSRDIGGFVNAIDDIFETENSATTDLNITVEILITSVIENTKPLRIKRKLCQRLKEARLIWCEKQPINVDAEGRSLRDIVFLTWRGKRLFDVTTCDSLGLCINFSGGSLTNEAAVHSSSNIHLEAWTEETLRAHESQIRTNRALIESCDENDERIKLQKQSSPKCKIIMKAKGMEPFKLAVRPTTTVSKLIDAFRKAKAISDDVSISLHFDGDILDPNLNIEDTELGDEENVDIVEVYLK